MTTRAPTVPIEAKYWINMKSIVMQTMWILYFSFPRRQSKLEFWCFFSILDLSDSILLLISSVHVTSLCHQRSLHWASHDFVNKKYIVCFSVLLVLHLFLTHNHLQTFMQLYALYSKTARLVKGKPFPSIALRHNSCFFLPTFRSPVVWPLWAESRFWI